MGFWDVPDVESGEDDDSGIEITLGLGYVGQLIALQMYRERAFGLLNSVYCTLVTKEPDARTQREDFLIEAFEAVFRKASVSLNMMEDQPENRLEISLRMREEAIKKQAAFIEQYAKSTGAEHESYKKVMQDTTDVIQEIFGI